MGSEKKFSLINFLLLLLVGFSGGLSTGASIGKMLNSQFDLVLLVLIVWTIISFYLLKLLFKKIVIDDSSSSTLTSSSGSSTSNP